MVLPYGRAVLSCAGATRRRRSSEGASLVQHRPHPSHAKSLACSSSRPITPLLSHHLLPPPSNLSAPAQPYVRSRTNLFLSYRDSAARPPSSYSRAAKGKGPSLYGGDEGEESRGLLMEDSVVLEMGGGVLPPKWVDIADRVDEIIAGVKPKSAYTYYLRARRES